MLNHRVHVKISPNLFANINLVTLKIFSSFSQRAVIIRNSQNYTRLIRPQDLWWLINIMANCYNCSSFNEQINFLHNCECLQFSSSHYIARSITRILEQESIKQSVVFGMIRRKALSQTYDPHWYCAARQIQQCNTTSSDNQLPRSHTPTAFHSALPICIRKRLVRFHPSLLLNAKSLSWCVPSRLLGCRWHIHREA
jgi:hypothetical protein